jgi:membrane-associated HD superfamily phosphohydrolase
MLLVPTAYRIEQLVHDLAVSRLSDGQFNEYNLTLKNRTRSSSR